MYAPGRWLPLAALAIALAAVLGGGRAARADGQDEADKRRRAGKHVEEGDRYKEAGEYDKAAREYEKAYDLVPHPELFFNLAQVYRLGGKKEKALEYYERYLAVQPNGRAAPQARTFARQLRKALGKSREEGAGPGAGPGAGSGSESGSGSGSESGSESGGDVTRRVDRDRPGRVLRIAGMASAGAGLVALAVGVKYGLDARRISDDLSANDVMWTDELLATQAEGKRAERRMFIATGLGAAFVAGGAVLYYLGHSARAEAAASGEEAAAVSAAPLIGGDAFGLAVSGHF
jgi:tetratricopeptide (TPR) repeat protein